MVVNIVIKGSEFVYCIQRKETTKEIFPQKKDQQIQKKDQQIKQENQSWFINFFNSFCCVERKNKNEKKQLKEIFPQKKIQQIEEDQKTNIKNTELKTKKEKNN